MIVAKAKALAKIILKGIAILLALLILIYAGFKIWEYQDLESKQAEKIALRHRLKVQYEDLARDQAAYAPLVVGSSSLDYIQRGNGEPIFTYLLGADLKLYQNLMEDSVPIIYVGKQILGSGCKKQGCGEGEAAFVIDLDSSKYFAAINQGGKVVFFGIEEGAPIPAAFQKWHGSQTSGDVK